VTGVATATRLEENMPGAGLLPHSSEAGACSAKVRGNPRDSLATGSHGNRAKLINNFFFFIPSVGVEILLRADRRMDAEQTHKPATPT
jgi:hypothetical protein